MTTSSYDAVDAPAAAVVRRRARAATAALGALLALPLVLGVAFGQTAAALAMVVAVVALVVLSELCLERQPARYSKTRLTASTLTGPRPLDLDRIASVRLWTAFGYNGVQQRVLLVRDQHGVRLGITTAASRRKLRAALERQTPRDGRGGPRVSRAARTCLAHDRGPKPALPTATPFLAQVLGMIGYVIVVLVAARP